MLEKPIWTGLLALALALPASAAARRGDDPSQDKTIVVAEPDDGDIAIDVDNDSNGDAGGDMDDGGPMILDLDGRRGGYLGLSLIDITPELREHFGAARDAGVLVGRVEKDSPAQKSGIEVGDLVTAADGERVESSRDLSRAIRRKKAGDSVRLEIERNHSKKSLTAAVAERPERSLRIGDLGSEMRRHKMVIRGLDGDTPLFGALEDREKLRQRLDDLEKKLKDLEKRLPSR